MEGSRTARGWLLGRLISGLVTVVLVTLLVFLATRALPGDMARIVLGRDATADAVAALHRELGLDRPLATQYLSWLGSVLVGDFGRSSVAHLPVFDLFAPRMLNTFTLVLLAMVVTIPLSILLGVMTAFWRDGWLDRVVMAISTGLNALPDFIVGMLLVVVFSTNVFHLLPAVSVMTPGEMPWRQPLALVLPCAVLALLNSAYLYRLIRASVIEVLGSEYVQMAMLKGLSSPRILFRHALPNAVVPAIQAMANVFAFSVGSVVVLEYLFGFPGIGTGLTDAVANRDVPSVQFVVLLIALVFVLSNVVADVVTAWLTPRGRSLSK